MRPAHQGQEGGGVGCRPGLPRGASASSWGPGSAKSTSQEVLVCTLLSEVCAPFHSWGAEAGPGSHPGKGVRETKATALPWPQPQPQPFLLG